MAYLKDPTKPQMFNQPTTPPFSNAVRRLSHISERGPYTVQYNGSILYPEQSRVVENYDQNLPGVETMSNRDAISEMKKQLHFLGQ